MSNSQNPEVPSPGKQSPWIYRPSIDLLIGCGGWSLALFWISYAASQHYLAGVAFVFYVLGLFSNNPHYMATIYRAYGTKEDFQNYRLFTVHLTILLILMIVVVHWSVTLFPIVWTIYLTWSPWHYTGQNYGLAAMFARRNGIQLTALERNLLYTSYLASYLVWFFSLHASRDHYPNILSLGIAFQDGVYLRLIFIAIFLVTSLHAFYLISARNNLKSLIGPLTLFATQFLWFVAPTVLELGFGFEFLPSSYSGGVLAFMHCTQYLWITSYYAKRENRGATESGKGWNPWRYFGIMFIGGVALFLPGPWLISKIFHHDLINSYLIFLAVVNIHHFILDGAIWKLRDTRIAQFLLNNTKEKANAMKSEEPSWKKTWKIIFGNSASAKAFRVVGVVGLLGIAFIDPYQYFLTLNASQSNLDLASTLNSSDSRILVRRASILAENGNASAATDALRKAVSLNPLNFTAQQLLGQFLMKAGNTEAAIDHYKKMANYFPQDLSARMYAGSLLFKSGKVLEALSQFQQAKKIDPNDAQVEAQLGQAYKALGDDKEAAHHFEAYENMKSPEDVNVREELLLKLQLAETYQRTGAFAKAQALYDEIQSKSRSLDLKSITFSSMSGKAALMDEMENVPEAAKLYQEVLGLASSSQEDEVLKSIWLNYSIFLHFRGRDQKLAYAAYLQAERLAAKLSPDKKMPPKIGEEFKHVLGKDSQLVENDLTTYIQRALIFDPKNENESSKSAN